MQRSQSLVFVLLFFVFGFFACQNNAGSGASKNFAPLNEAEYTYFSTDFKPASLNEQFKLEKITEKSYNERYNNKPANYKLKAYKIIRQGDSAASALLIEMDTDRAQSSLTGKAKRKNDKQFICIPSSKSDSNLFKQYDAQTRNMGYKDAEVYTSFITQVLAELYL